jgi:hypothetical protein
MIDILNQSSDVYIFLEGAIYLRVHALAIGVGAPLLNSKNPPFFTHRSFTWSISVSGYRCYS